MIFLFKDGLLLITLLNILKQIACTTYLSIIAIKKSFDSQMLLTAVTRAPAFSVRRC